MVTGGAKLAFFVLLVVASVFILTMTFLTGIIEVHPSIGKLISIPVSVTKDTTQDYAYSVELSSNKESSTEGNSGTHSVKLFNASGICNVTVGKKDTSGREFFSTGSNAMCVAVLTGYPDVARREYLERVLANIRNDVVAPEPFDLHVFCQGSCHVTVCDELRHSAIYHEIEKTIHMEKNAGSQTMKDILHPMRWYYLSQNYFFMFEQLFVRRKRPYKHCVIIEDDLVLSPDALLYARAGMDLMDKDDSVFSVSFSNDNSHFPHAHVQSNFRRIDHFSGLGFMISQYAYLRHVRQSWVRNKAWDIMVQWMFNRKGGLVSIQPEVMRAIHESDKSLKNMSHIRNKHQRLAIADKVLDKNAYSLEEFTEENYDRSIREHIILGIPIKYISDAAFFTTDEKLLFTNCSGQIDMDRIMSNRRMVGIGLGKVVRGVYKNTVFIRLYYAKILVVCRNSPFFSEISPTKSNYDPTSLSIPLERSVKRKFLGPIYAISQSYTNIISEVNQSCVEACRKRSLPCDSYGLLLLEEGCEVIYYFFKQCLICKISTNYKKEWPKPSMDNEQTCFIGTVLSPCDLKAPYNKRLCSCKKA